jgi:hypothetical protein
MSEAFVVEVWGEPAGIVLKEGNAFCFHAVAGPFFRRRPRLTGLLIALALAGAAAWFVARPSSAPARQAAIQANLGDQAQLVGYALDRAVYRLAWSPDGRKILFGNKALRTLAESLHHEWR